MRKYAITFLGLFYSWSLFSQIHAFPGAEGYGSTTPGGRGGEVIKVTNLNADGPGSLRAALEGDKGPRIVVFETGGEIDLQGDNIIITSPYLTVAGQTAPGDGILIKNGLIRIGTHDVVIRGLRFRKSHYQRPGEHFFGNVYGGINCSGSGTYNIVVDHCSFAWSVAAGSGVLQGAHDITFSWCIFAEGLHCNMHAENCHSKGLVFHRTAGGNLSAHHNVFISNDARNPNILSPHNEVVNNYIYNCGVKPMHAYLKAGRTANVIGNHFKPGPDSYDRPSNPDLNALLVEYAIDGMTGDTGTVPQSIYVFENTGPTRPVITSNTPEEEWSVVDDYSNVRPDVPTPERGEAQSLVVFPSSGITITPTEELESVLFSDCGAGAITPFRDEVDERVLNSALTDSGKIVDCVSAEDIVIEDLARGGSAQTIVLSQRASNENDTHKGRTIQLVAGTGAGQSATIMAYEAATQTAYVNPPWSTPPDNTSVYQIIVDCSNNAGGWPEPLNPGTPPLDSDDDGMPDDWELEYGTDPNLPDDDEDLDGNGYTNIEEYINSLICPPMTTSTTPAPSPEPTLLTLYPNPARDFVHMEAANPKGELREVRVFDARGRLVASAQTPEERFTLYVGGLSPGLFFVELASAENGQPLARGRFVVQ